MSRNVLYGKGRVLFLFLVVGNLCLLLTSCITKPQPVVGPMGHLPIQAAHIITAGEPVTVTVGPILVGDGIQVVLIALGSYGPRIYQSSFLHKMAKFLLPGKETQQSGVVTLTAVAGKAQGSTQLLIQPAPPVEPLTPLIGARAIIADAEHWSMTVLVPFDAFGNPVMEGTSIQVLVQHPGNSLEKKLLVVHNLVAWTRVFSRIKAGRTTIVARIGNIHGFAGTLLEVAGWPIPFNLSADPQSLPADGRLITTLRTDSIHDKFGNVMPDGTLLTFIVKAPDGTVSSIPAYTINGVAEAPLQAPRQAGFYTVQATILGVESTKLIVHFTPGPAVGTFPIIVQKNIPSKAYELKAGPLLGSLGQYIPDGTPVYFFIRNARGQIQQLDGVSDAGYASVELPPAQFPKGAYSARVTAGFGQAMLLFTLR